MPRPVLQKTGEQLPEVPSAAASFETPTVTEEGPKRSSYYHFASTPKEQVSSIFPLSVYF